MPHICKRIHKAIAGWVKRAPGSERFPVPKLAVHAVVGDLLSRAKPLHALAAEVSLSGYLRPTDMDSLLVKELIPPQTQISATYKCWALVLHSSESCSIGKTGGRDETILLDDEVMMSLSPVMYELVRGADPNSKLFPFSQEDYSREIRNSVVRLGLENVGFVPYSLRHAGASGDFLENTRTLQEIQFRGRWRSEKSLKRYCKASLAQAVAAEIRPEVIEYGRFVQTHLAALLMKRKAMPPPPVVNLV